jgi:hypothetical protein
MFLYYIKMSVKNYLSHAVAKPLFAGIAAAVGEHFIMKNDDLKSCAIIGGAVGGGIFSVSWVEPLVSKLSPTNTFIGTVGKTLEGRILEIACGTGAVYVLNRYVLKNEVNVTSKAFMTRVGIIAGADLIGESVCEFLIII